MNLFHFTYLKSFIYVILVIITIPGISKAQTTGSLQSGSTNTLSVTLSNTMGVQTSADANANVEVNNEANLVIEAGSTIQDSFGDEETTEISGDFEISPNGANFDVKGLTAKNNYIIGEGTYFKSELKSVDEPDPDQRVQGTASSQLVHNMTLSINQQSSSFVSAFSQNF